MSPGILKIGISGKRQIHSEETGKLYTEIRDRIATLLLHHRANDFIGYTSLAIGADTLFAQVVLQEFHKPIRVILPFPVEEYEQDFEGKDLLTFRNLLGRAERIECAAPLPIDDNARNDGYFLAGKKIVDASDGMVIVWDGQKPGGIGGTAEILGYLSEKKELHSVPYIKVRPSKIDPIHEELIHTYNIANRLAIRARNKYKRVWKTAIFLGWLTVGCFAVKTAFRLEGWPARLLTLCEFIFVAAVYILIYFAKRRNYHGHYLHERMKAETCRLLRSFYHAGVEIGISDQSKEEDTALALIAEKINRSLKNKAPLKWYAQYVIKSIINDQCTYHSHKIKSIGDNHQVFERINLFIGILFFTNLTVHLAHVFIIWEGVQEMWLYKFSIFFNILLPASYAAFEGVIYFNEWALLRKYSDTAIYSLQEARTLLPEKIDDLTSVECHQKQAQVLHLISGIMLTDNRNWNLLLENKDNYHLIV